MNRVTKVIGCIFFNGWALLGAIFYIKAIIDFIV